jgi:hypothetical protein
VTLRTCLRCDWEGESTAAKCPQCGGASLFDLPPPRPPTVPQPATTSADRKAVVEPERRRPRAAVVAVLGVLVATLLWFATRDDGAPSVGAQSFAPASGSPPPTPYIPTFVGNIRKVAGAEVPVAPGRHTVQVEGVPLSFDIPADGWQQAEPLYLSKSPDSGPAEVLLYWTQVDEGAYARPCGQWWGAPPGSTLDFARSAARGSGVDAPLAATDVRVGGAEGASVGFGVIDDKAACQPGFLYRWRTSSANDSWTGIQVGDTVQIWVVDFGQTRLVIEADTRVGAPAWLKAELQHIVASIRFELIG